VSYPSTPIADDGLEAAPLDAYGVAPDPDRMAYFRERWEE
jgi:hypothetical protein